MIEDLKVRERAYELWEKDGRPEGSEELYWRLAQEQLEAEATPQAASEWPATGEASRFDH
ncbi:DUF2934 domain-containing protein [Pseudomonas sp. IT-P74]|uniref:DUF2934 domain-containing protein n=1 Tax=Pseudomonas sp. IT-P74 TaxID=3026445 RepID=UPI0039DFDEEC